MKKRSLSLVLAFAMILALTCGAWAALTPNADGVYEIGTAAELAEFRDMVNAGQTDLDAKLTANITMPAEAWMPIGTWADSPGGSLDYSYVGTFDGNGKQIDGLTLRSSDMAVFDGLTTRYAGLFGLLHFDAGAGKVGTIKNLVLSNVDIDFSDDATAISIAPLVGFIRGASIYNCGVDGGNVMGPSDSSTSGVASGGLVGYAALTDGSSSTQYTVISNCYVKNLETIGHGGNGSVGGLAGVLGAGARLSNSYVSNVKEITSRAGNAGGLVGFVSNSLTNPGAEQVTTIANCYAQNVGKITSVTAQSSTLVGRLYGTQPVAMQNCVYLGTGELEASTYEGGLVARLDDRADPEPYLHTIQNCLYPTGIDFSIEDRPIGNMSSDDLVAAGRGDLLPYSTASDDSELPAIVAILEQGYTVTLVVGETHELDVTTFPGTMGNFVGHWSSTDDEIVSWVSASDGLYAKLTANAVGTAAVTVKVRGTVNVDLTCNVIVVDAVDVETDPADDSIYLNDEDVSIIYNFDPYKVVGLDTTGLAGSGLDAVIDPADDSKVLLTKIGVLQAGPYFYIVTLEGADGSQITQTIPVVIQGGSRPTGGGGGGSSNCNSGVGAAMFALLGLAFVYKKK